MRLAIIYDQFFDRDGDQRRIGGVETYLYHLACLGQKSGFDTTIFQWSNRSFIRQVGDFQVVGVPVAQSSYHARSREMYDRVRSQIDEKHDLLVFGADHKSVRTTSSRHISIQHGVAFDLPARFLSTRRLVNYPLIGSLVKARVRHACKVYFENCRNTVCVDYNFLNWYRTAVPEPDPGKRVWVIPNFAQIPDASRIAARGTSANPLRILFARRFVEFRGTRIFAAASKQILSEHKNVRITFAGDGPDERWLRDEFRGEERVEFERYAGEDAMNIHLRHHIAVVPSLASEGTSLAVAEAMAAGCSVVATAVGGITNMILDGFNGLLVEPSSRALLEGLRDVIKNDSYRARLGRNASLTASSSFSHARWEERWSDVLGETAARSR